MQIPSLPTSILSARYQLHEIIRSKTDSFQWLSDGRRELGNDEYPDAHDIHSPSCRTVRMTISGYLVIAVTSYRRALSYDATVYYGSYKDWISPVAQYYPLNPTRSFRLVSFQLVIRILTTYIVVPLYHYGYWKFDL